MKKGEYFTIAVFFSLLLFSCRNNSEKETEKATDLLTTKTLGLAYLEEFRHEEAEKEFLKLIKLAPGEKLGYANLGLTYLRTGRYKEAEEQLLKAKKIDIKDPDIRLILATVYQMDDRKQLAKTELQEALAYSPAHIKILYFLSELNASDSDDESVQKREDYTKKLLDAAPGNLVPYLNLSEIYIKKGEPDKAVELLEIIKKQFPEFPKESVEYYDKTLTLLRKKDNNNAFVQFTIFHNYLKVSSPYQAGMVDLKGPGGSLIGFPLITFANQTAFKSIENGSITGIIKFTDATVSAGLDVIKQPEGNSEGKSELRSHITASDFDGNGDVDIYAGSYDPSSSAYRHFLLMNETGRFTDVTGKTGIKHTGSETSASFADYDNDGFLDLLIVKEEGNLLYRNADKGLFTNVTQTAKIGNTRGANKALCFDADHDGDLDIFEINPGANLLFRNNGDGTFTEQAEKMGLAGKDLKSTDAAFGDFDDDGDIDLVVVNETGDPVLYSNQRQGFYKDVSVESGLKAERSGAVAVGDYNNDGFLDIFIASAGQNRHQLYQNMKDGKFELVKNNNEIFGTLNSLECLDAEFLDYDNDGLNDLLMAGKPGNKSSGGLVLLRNDGNGRFINVSGLFSSVSGPVNEIAVFDYNEDGDLDIAVAAGGGGIKLLRNDGGNNNHFIKMKLVGLKAGSAKNNHFGIGAKVEMRSGDLYNLQVVTDPDIHFGIGNRSKADVIRITWTNGVPQNIFLPGSDKSIVEAQTLKGSCPFLYAWDGKEYKFVKDIIWRSALGMPTGIMGGNTTYAFADASDDLIKVEGDKLKPGNGRYSIQVTSELWETVYFDKVRLMVVDHPGTTEIYVPEQFSPPPFPGEKIFVINNRITPLSAIDENGNDLLQLITAKDEKYIGGFNPGRFQGVTGLHELILDPGKDAETDNLHLFMTGWIFPTDASINVAISQSDNLKIIPPVVQVTDSNGEWVTIIENAGFPMGKDKTVIADLSGKFISADHRVRIITNMEIYWDEIFFSDNMSPDQVVTNVLEPVKADIHYRGFSRLYRKGGRYGPHWFDYSDVEKDTKWRDLQGNYTRYGDVLPLLMESDNKYIISNAGDETTIEFSTENLPELKHGWKRDFLIHGVGWVKDGDLNTALGNTVMPLPFHGMKSYPPSESDKYPDTPDLQKYNREYNTRVVTQEGYLNALKFK